MAFYEGRGGEDVDNHGVSFPQHWPNSQGGGDDRDCEGRRGRREKKRDRDEDRDTDRDRRHHRDRHRDRSKQRERRGRTRDGDDDSDFRKSRGYERRRDYDRDGEKSHRHRYRSISQDRRSERRSSSLPRSRSKSGRVSGFDIAPAQITLPPQALDLPVMPSMLQLPVPFPVQATRNARRVFVGGIPPSANEQSVATFFNHLMCAIGGNTAGPGEAVVNVYINHEKKFAFVEMRTVEEASNAMALNGIIFEGGPVKVGRPTDYNPALAATLGPNQPNPNLNLAAVGLTPGSIGGLEGPDRIFIGGLAYQFTDTQIRTLLESFGTLRGFDLVNDRETGNSKGYAFCVYQDPSVTDTACAVLNGLKLCDKTLTVRRANQNISQQKTDQETALLQARLQIDAFLKSISITSKVLCLTEVLSLDELSNDDYYEEIVEDMRSECAKFGTLVKLVIPRSGPNGEVSPGVGKVFLEYTDVESASKAQKGLNGRKFDENLVVAVSYPENKFSEGDYSG